MGNDGGSIPGRKDLVKEKGREKKLENNDLVESSKAKYCSLSKEPLKKPVVGCRLGFLYNKEALINAMLDKRLPKIYSHITSLKDVKDLKIQLAELNGETKIICPISMIEFSGLNTFYFFWNCGCLISKNAFEELNMKDKCILCGKDFNKETDLVNINQTREERARLFQKIISEKLNKQSKKINQKNKQKKQAYNKERIDKNKSKENNGLGNKNNLDLNEVIINKKISLINDKDSIANSDFNIKGTIDNDNEKFKKLNNKCTNKIENSEIYLINKKRKRSEDL